MQIGSIPRVRLAGYGFVFLVCAVLMARQFSGQEVWRYYSDGKPKLHVRSDRHGNYQGDYVVWHPNGQVLCRGRYVDDQPDGVWEVRHANGQLSLKGAYSMGSKYGDWWAWDEAGCPDPRRSGTFMLTIWGSDT